ncbi:hypothetical protein NVV94_10380 [Pseudomonas sp. LS1212]|uniref:RCC1 domain-containing protein n=1 Tax=Pseudomonas sp. LS1212 TaxID=2972478 RepID=UPI00215C194A|nr:hypothetical protein [Pseudomonas sp. LS1212]UVJ45909.1 hypothetical protein NVV94_10380 [Pseudomonas sp. LS1212]
MSAFSMFAAGSRTLLPIYISGQIMPVNGADVGVNYHMVHASTSGLLITVQAYTNMREGDWIDVFWGSPTVSVASGVVGAADVNNNVLMYVPAANIPTGINDLFCRVTRAGGGNPEESTPLSVLVKLDFPGGTDPEPDAPGHQLLVPPGIEGDVSEPVAVPVTIEPYPNMREYDTIQLSWGGEFVFHVVQPGEVGQSIEIIVPPETILAAGDSDALVVVYRVIDEVQNVSSDWSLRAFVYVEASGSRLMAPIVADADENDVIDLDLLGQNDVTVQVIASRPDFAVADTVTLTWTGTTAQGQPVEHVEQKAVVIVGRILEFLIPNSKVREIVRSRAVVSYVLTKAAGGAPLPSKRASVSVVGAAVRLPAPTVLEAVGGTLEPTLAQARVQVPAYAGMLAGDVVKISWLGLRANGTPYLFETQRTVSNSQVGRPLTFTVAGTHIAILDGGSLEVYYRVSSDTSPAPLESDRLALQVGEAQAELPAPTVPAAENGVLDPDAVPDGTEVVIAPYSNMKIGDTVYLEWRGSTGAGSFSDFVPIGSGAVGKEVTFWVDAKYIEANRNGEVEVWYRVERSGVPTRTSGRLQLRIGVAVEVPLAAPVVLEAVGGVLNPGDATRGATVQIAVYDGMAAGDEVHLSWVGDGAGGSYSDFKSITGNTVGRPVVFTVPYAYVLANQNGNVHVFYRVDRFEGGSPESSVLTLRVQSAQLPLPSIVQANGNQLNPDDVLNGASVRIDASAQLKDFDVVTVSWLGTPGAGTTTVSQSVPAGGGGQALIVTVPYAVVNANNGNRIALSYSIRRNAGGPEEQSDVVNYDVNRVIGAGDLRVMGARYNRNTYRASGASYLISAFNANTNLPLLAEWRYADEVAWVSATTWRDTKPWLPLHVRSSTDQVTLNPANIIGSGNDTTINGTAAFVAHRDTGDVVGWGNPANGGFIPPTIITMDDIVEGACTRSAYAARRENGFVVVWGNAAEGGSLGAVPAGDFVSVISNAMAFAGRKSSGQVVAWGTAANGATVPPAIDQLRDITDLYGGGSAFAARRATGQVVAWGSPANGGTVPADIGGFTDIVRVVGSYAAFAALRGNRRVVAWGNAAYGGNVPAYVATLTDITELSGANARAFTALRATGQVVAWGDINYGALVPDLIKSLTDIVEVTSTWRAFAARRRNGHVVAWGTAAEGGVVPDPIASLSDIVQVVGSAMSFAALRRNGTVVAWGNVTTGGDTSAVVGQLTNVRAIYANSHGFTALTSDGRVVTWGQPAGGGDSSAVQDRLRGQVSYQTAPGLAASSNVSAAQPVSASLVS